MVPSNELSRKVILVTGPAGNLGSAVVKRFQNESVSLILLDRHPDRINERYPDLDASNDHLLLPNVDLTEPAIVGAAVNSGLENFGHIDCLVHTTGGFQMGEKVHQITQEKLDQMMDINVKTLLNITRFVLPAMIEQENGMIITIGARPSLEGKKEMGAYSAAKAAVLRLTESIAAEGKSTGLSARCIIPGTIDTSENRAVMPNADTSKWIKPETIADVIYKTCFDTDISEHDIIINLY